MNITTETEEVKNCETPEIFFLWNINKIIDFLEKYN